MKSTSSLRGSQRPSRAVPLTVRWTVDHVSHSTREGLDRAAEGALGEDAGRGCGDSRPRHGCRTGDRRARRPGARRPRPPRPPSPSRSRISSAARRRTGIGPAPAVTSRAEVQRWPSRDDDGRDPDDGEVAVAPAELLEGEAGAVRHRGQPHLDEHLVGGERGGEIAPGTARPPRACARPAGPRDDHLALERGERRSGIPPPDRHGRGCRRWCRACGSADGRPARWPRPAAADRGATTGENSIVRWRVIAPSRTWPVLLADVGERCDPVQIDEGGRPAQPEVEQRQRLWPPASSLASPP